MTPKARPDTFTPKDCTDLMAPVIRAHRLIITSLIAAIGGVVALFLQAGV